MAETTAEEDGSTAVTAAPRPRSLFEETWEEPVVDLVPSPEDRVPGVSPSPAARRPGLAGTSPADPSAVGDIPADAPLPWARRPVLDSPQQYLPLSPADDGERLWDGAREAPAPRPAARPGLPGQADGTEARAGTDGERMTHAAPPSPAPGPPPVTVSPAQVPAHVPAPPHGIGEDAPPPGTVPAPVGNATTIEAAPAREVVRAEPVPAAPDTVAPPAEPPAESAPVVVEIERVEVRVVADRPSAPLRERRPRPRTGPSLDEYLGGTAGRGTA